MNTFSRLIYLLVAVFTLVLLTGCQTTASAVKVDTSWYVPDFLLLDCDVVPPPDQKAYEAQAQWVDKEKMWLDTYAASLKAVTKCNADKRAIRDDQTKQKALRDSSHKE